MTTLPEASVQIDDEAGALAGGTDLLTVFACVEKAADLTPRMFSSTKALLAKHGYAPAVDYCAMHFEETKKPVLFVGLPTVTAGAIGHVNVAGNTGTSVLSVAAGAAGVLEEVSGVVTVSEGGTVGTDQISFDLSLDGGSTSKKLRLGTGASIVLPYVGLTLAAAAGTLVAGDVALRFSTTAPRWDQAGLAAARAAMVAQQKQSRSWLVVGDLLTSADANAVVAEANAYETANTRFVTARAHVRDGHARIAMAGTHTLTFAEVGGTGDTITRSAGSWLADGLAVGDVVTVTGTVSNNVTGPIAALSATVLTFGSTDLVAEVISSTLATVAAGELDSDWVSAIDAGFAVVDAQRRIDIGAGRGRKVSPITGWNFRRPVTWAASLREYQHDVQVPVWRKADGPCDGWSLEDDQGNLIEHDERNDGGLLAARFTCARTYANGPRGMFIALSLTRAAEGSLLSRTHNMAVANVACAVVQAETENAIGQVLELNDDGTGRQASLFVLEERVNSALGIALLQRKSEGPRASEAKWKASRTDILNIPEAELTGTMDLRLDGTLERITTRVRVATAG